MTDINYGALDPGIRETVKFLRSHDFETTDSGDGVSKPKVGRVFDFPHVFMQCRAEDMIAESGRLRRVVEDRIGRDLEQGQIQATYDPVSNVALLMLAGVTI